MILCITTRRVGNHEAEWHNLSYSSFGRVSPKKKIFVVNPLGKGHNVLYTIGTVHYRAYI